ncbi:hypothetical protein [Savagea faecisuis]|uniref:Uncharacterized protein n=1 Tax=Savagea faecisuis TaxID=1274803 RepID=A0ABW3GUW7_9BACL
MVIVQQLEQEVLKEQQLLQTATTYRQQTVELALQVVRKAQNTVLFCTKAGSQVAVSKMLPSADHDRQLDVAKMLHVLYIQINNQQQYSVEMQQELAARTGKLDRDAPARNLSV